MSLIKISDKRDYNNNPTAQIALQEVFADISFGVDRVQFERECLDSVNRLMVDLFTHPNTDKACANNTKKLLRDQISTIMTNSLPDIDYKAKKEMMKNKGFMVNIPVMKAFVEACNDGKKEL